MYDKRDPRDAYFEVDKHSKNYIIGVANGYAEGYDKGRIEGYIQGVEVGIRKAYARYKQLNPNYEAMRLKK